MKIDNAFENSFLKSYIQTGEFTLSVCFNFSLGQLQPNLEKKVCEEYIDNNRCLVNQQAYQCDHNCIYQDIGMNMFKKKCYRLHFCK